MNALDTDPIIDSPSPCAPRRSRARWVALGAAVMSVAAITAGLVLTAPDDGPTPRIVETPIQDAPPTPAPPTPKTLTGSSRLEVNGIGPIVVGMTLDEASAAHGKPVAFDPRTVAAPGWKRGCAHAIAEGGPEGLRFMVVDGRIVRIEAQRGPVATPEGMTTGSPVPDVLAAYAGRIRVELHPYSRTGGQYLIVDETLSGTPMSILFETDGSRVTQFRSGLTGAVMAPEGCS
ncbi:MAG: hypothetical protein ACR2KK_04010 [Acidimicrobiales bacterium]